MQNRKCFFSAEDAEKLRREAAEETNFKSLRFLAYFFSAYSALKISVIACKINLLNTRLTMDHRLSTSILTFQ